MTLKQAKEYASSNNDCYGFTYNTVEREPTGVIHVWFKSRLNVLYNENWWTYSNGRGME